MMIKTTNRNAETASQYEVGSFLFGEMEVKHDRTERKVNQCYQKC